MQRVTPAPHGLEQAFEHWIEAFRGPLIGLLASWGADWRAAEELAQDTFAEAWLGRARFEGDPDDLGAAGAWLRGIAFHLHQAGVRKRARLLAVPLEDEHEQEPSERDPRHELLERALAELPAPQQTVLRMHYLEQTSAREVAALLSLSPKAVEGRLYQARKALRAAVDQLARKGAPADATEVRS